MKARRFDHIDLRVKNMEEAKRFYTQILPALGFPSDESSGAWQSYGTGLKGPTEFFGFIEDPNHQTNETRIAFWAETREEVDRVAEVVRGAGGQNLEGPELCGEYTPDYYAFFFEDPSGNKLEICCRGRAIG